MSKAVTLPIFVSLTTKPIKLPIAYQIRYLFIALSGTIYVPFEYSFIRFNTNGDVNEDFVTAPTFSFHLLLRTNIIETDVEKRHCVPSYFTGRVVFG